jgi:hypothetical protein
VEQRGAMWSNVEQCGAMWSKVERCESHNHDVERCGAMWGNVRLTTAMWSDVGRVVPYDVYILLAIRGILTSMSRSIIAVPGEAFKYRMVGRVKCDVFCLIERHQ